MSERLVGVKLSGNEEKPYTIVYKDATTGVQKEMPASPERIQDLLLYILGEHDNQHKESSE